MLVCTGMPHQLSSLSLPKIQACDQFFLLLFSLELMLILFLGCFSVLQQGIILHILRHLMTAFFWSFFYLPSRTILSGTQNSLGFDLGWCYRWNAIVVGQNRGRGDSAVRIGHAGTEQLCAYTRHTTECFTCSRASFFGSLLLVSLVIKHSKCTSTKNLCASGWLSFDSWVQTRATSLWA